jgi:hypothetical protein
MNYPPAKYNNQKEIGMPRHNIINYNVQAKDAPIARAQATGGDVA